MLTSPKGNLVDTILVKRLISKIKELRDFISDKGLCVIKGSSLFFTSSRDYFDDWKNYEEDLKIAEVTLIDQCFMQVIQDPKERDWGFIKGLESTIAMLTEIMEENE